MQTMTKTTGREFRVEGHGTELAMFGGVSSRVNAYAREPLLTREGAWSTVRRLVQGGRYHTIKVFRGGEIVFRAFRQLDGTYIDAKTCKTIA